MKTFYHLLITLFLLLTARQADSQCTPVDCLGSLPPYGGICESALDTGRVNVPYSDVVSFHITNVCVDAGEFDPLYAGTGAKLKKLHTFSFSGFPAGLSGATNQTEYNAPANGCGAISGTPTEVGVFDATIHILANINTYPGSITCGGWFPIPINNMAFDGSLSLVILPDAFFTGLDSTYCANHSAVTLTVTGTAGGTFSGPGVTGNTFNPALAGPGTHQITYTVSAQQGGAIAPATNHSTVTVKVYANPVALAGNDVTYSGTPVQIGDASNGPGIITWQPSSGLNNPSSPQPLVSPSSTTTYTVTVNNHGCIASDAVTVTVGGGYSITGKTRFLGKANAGNPPTYNSVIYNIGQVIVILKNYPDGTEVSRDTSDNAGNYYFTNVPNGNYILSYDKYTVDTMVGGNDINAIDVALVKYYIGADTLADPTRNFSSKYKKTANVDNNTAINAVDIARLKAKIGAPYATAKNFPKGNWVSMDTLISMSGADMNIILKTGCYGDYNASSSRYRDSLTNWNMTKALAENIIKTSGDFIVTTNSSFLQIPLSFSTRVHDFSALGLELNYDDAHFKLVSAKMSHSDDKSTLVKINPTLDEIIADDNDLLVTDDNGVIRVVFATTGYYDVNAGDPVIIFGFSSKNDQAGRASDFQLSGTGVIGDQYGNEITDAYLAMPEILIQGNTGPDAMLDLSAYPNPFNNKTSISYNLPESGNVSLKVINALGKIVAVPVNEHQSSGCHTTEFSGKGFPAGIYSIKLEFEGGQKSGHTVIKMIKRTKE